MFADPARRAKIAAALPKLDALFAEAAAKQRIPALAVGLVVDGQLAWSKGYGSREEGQTSPVDADTVFRIGSITKTFTALAALQLRDMGRLSLDEPASRWIPELAEVVYPTSDAPPITLRMLLTHTAGLPRIGRFTYVDPKRAPTEEEVVRSLRGLYLDYTPGVGGMYSNLGAGLAGIVVGRAAGMPYRDYVTAYLLRPLGMASTTWDLESAPPGRLATAYADDEDGTRARPEHWRLGASEGAGGIYSTVLDMARWAAMHLQAFPPRDETDAWPVKRATLREAMTTQRSYGLRALRVDSVTPVEASSTGVGFAWQTLQDCTLEDVVWHNGATDGYAANVAMLPMRGVALVLLSNLRDADLQQPSLRAFELLARAGAIPTRTPVVSPALVEARDRTLRLLQKWDDAEATRLIEPTLIVAAGGLVKMRERRDFLAEKVGTCAAARGDIDASSPMTASWAYACERGSLEVDASLAATAPVRVGVMSIRAVVAPNDALDRAATRVASLSAKWDDATYDELLSPAFDRAKLQRFFEDIARDAGTCTVDRAIDGDGVTKEKWRLSCAKIAMNLELSLDAKTGRVSRLLVVPAGPAADARCPK